MRVLAIVALAAILSSASADGGKDAIRVDTANGPVLGRSHADHGIRAFLGVPYAEPPVGARRWAPATRPKPWREVRNTQRYSLAAVQAQPRSYQNIGERGEDCLYLNVYSAARKSDELAPVFFWIHGGAFVSGTAMSPNYDGSVLAQEGLCVIVPNYRLGALGFLAHPALSAEYGASGNQALSDLVLALEWVRDNARAFGGDPGNVTIAGQSAGGSAVTALMCSKRARGLFHKAIVQSGGAAGNLRPLRDRDGRPGAEPYGLAFAEELGIKGDDDQALAALRAVPVQELVAAWRETQRKHGRFNLCQDGVFLEQSPGTVFQKGKQFPVPVLVGATADEVSMFLMRDGVKDLDEYRAWIERRFEGEAQAALAVYSATTPAEARTMQVRCGNDGYAAHARAVARSASRMAPTWRYRFTRVSPFGESLRMGSFHGAEVAYLFGRVELGERYHEVDMRLARRLRAYWIAFCRNGDPNADGLPAWPGYEAKSDRFLILDDDIRVGQAWRSAACDLYDAIWSAE